MGASDNETIRRCLQKLQQQRADISAALAEAERSSQPVALDQSKVGRVSRIDAIQQQQLARSSVEALRVQASQVDQALLRLRDGEFGECLECGEQIAEKRLLARPESAYCLQCQAALEDN